MTAALLALIAASLFCGAAFYISFAEHPARMQLPIDMARRQWSPSYARGFIMQASLAVAGGALGLIGWWITGRWALLAGALLLLANWPYTLIVIMPTNHRLHAASPGNTDFASLLARWNRLHFVRIGLSSAATLAFLAGSL